MAQYADVSINLAQIDNSYHYVVPLELEGRLRPGNLVIVPFGKQVVQGVVLEIMPETEIPNPLPIQDVVSEEAILTTRQLDLARWLTETTLAPLGACVNLMIPVGLSQHADILATREPDTTPDPANLGPLQKRLLALLTDRGSLTGSQLDHALPKLNWRPSLNALSRLGLVSIQNHLPPPRVAAKSVRSLQLSIPPHQVPLLADRQLGAQPATATRRRKVLEALAREPFPIDFSWIYAETGANYADLKVLTDAGLTHFNETEVWRDPLQKVDARPSQPPVLTPDQERVWQAIQPILGRADGKPFLLHGVTGSGKTEIYLRAVADTLAQGKQALVMVPEIAMTPQAVRRFMSRFPNLVGLYHHKLSDGERYDTWRRARLGDLKIIIGSRSALFVPLPDLGLIVIDECDHDSYDETERLPFYHAVETAEKAASLAGANLVLGSATPRVTQYHRALQGEWQLLELPRRVLAHRDALAQQALNLHADLPLPDPDHPLCQLELPPVQVVDMRRELREGHADVLSRPLRMALREVLEAGQQSILFLNRKGSASYVFCRECGYTLRCPRDDHPLVFHSARERLVCHICGYQRQMPSKCPQCGSRQIRQLGLGTEKLETLVKSSFPDARLLRWDAETTTGKDAHELILSHFSAHRADILIGTQMLAKGLDLPLVTLVGIVLAEVGLGLPDYRAAERTFQVLTQVSGRAGRSPLGGRVILQTYQPESYVIQAAANHDFQGFYHQELGFRETLQYPPFCKLVRLEFRASSDEKCQLQARMLAEILSEKLRAAPTQDASLIGPVPCYYPRLHGLYRWQVILRASDPLSLLHDVPLRDWRVEVDPPDLL